MTDQTITYRDLTQKQRTNFGGHSQSMFNKALHALGKEAKDLDRTAIISNDDGSITRRAEFQIGEVAYSIEITAHRDEMTS